MTGFVSALGLVFLIGFATALVIVPLNIAWILFTVRQKRRRGGNKRQPASVAFYHPYCGNCGGGEAVLWHAVASLIEKYAHFVNCSYLCIPRYGSSIRVSIFASSSMSDSAIFARVERELGVSFEEKLRPQIVHLRTCDWSFYPFPILTLLLQSAASVVGAIEAMAKYIPDVVIDSTGLAFTYPVFATCGSEVISYTHYPTISAEMLRAVRDKQVTVNNRSTIVNSPLLTKLKLVYYRGFAWLYRLCGRQASLVMVNGSWTCNNIEKLWKKVPEVVYPPCGEPLTGEQAEKKIQFARECAAGKRQLSVVSIGQFRPEKDHFQQVATVQNLVEKHPELRGRFKLTMIGSTRCAADEQLKQSVRDRVHDLGLDDVVEIPDTVSFSRKQQYLYESVVALHTMKNEHFGIVVVEFLANGVVPVAHKSAGPLLDIVVPALEFKTNKQPSNECGLLAENDDEYAEALAFLLKTDCLDVLVRNGIKQSEKFSTRRFKERFVACVDKYIPKRKLD